MMRGRPVLAAGESRAAKAREQAWLEENARPPKPAVTMPAEPEAQADGPPPASADEASEPPPLDELVYWSQCAHMLRDLHGAADAQVERLRRRCLERGVTEMELDERIEAAMPAPVRAVGAGVLAPSGWYPDPAGGAGHRYWTGTAWSEKVR